MKGNMEKAEGRRVRGSDRGDERTDQEERR